MDRRLSVLQVGKFYPPHVGGIETHLQVLSEASQAEGKVDLVVLVANDGPRTQEGKLRGVKVIRVGTAFEFAATPICPRLIAEIRGRPADIIHLHYPNPMAVLAYLASGHEGRLVVTYHSDVVRQKLLGWTFQPFLMRTLRRASAIIATSPDYAASSPVLRRCPQTTVVPYGIPLEMFQQCDAERVAAIRQRYGQRLIISVGRLIYYKGFEYLIRAMASVDATLLLVGEGPLRSALEREAAEANVRDKVVFLGEIQNDDIAPYYHACDLFVLPSVARSEAFGIVQLEAMACGKPVINTRLASGVPFVSRDGETGLTVPPADVPALAKAIERLLNDDPLRERFGDAARHRVESEFTASAMVDKTFAIYEEITERRRDNPQS